MISFTIKIADFVFDISTKYEDTKQMCMDYLCNEDSCFSISINQEDIDYERKKSIEEAIYEGRIPEDFSDAYLETISVYRKIAEYISNQDTCVFHGSLIALNNEGYLFTGKSGIGKTTHTKNWCNSYKDAKVINGDKPILRIINNEVIGYGTPWCGKECLQNNDFVKVKAIIEVKRDASNHIEKCSMNDCLPLLLSQTYRSSDNEGVKKALQMAVKIGSLCSLYRLYCNTDIESAKIAYEGMNQ